MNAPPFPLVVGTDSKDLLTVEYYNDVVRYLARLSDRVDGTQFASNAALAISKLSRGYRIGVKTGVIYGDRGITSDKFLLSAGNMLLFFGQGNVLTGNIDVGYDDGAFNTYLSPAPLTFDAVTGRFRYVFSFTTPVPIVTASVVSQTVRVTGDAATHVTRYTLFYSQAL